MRQALRNMQRQIKRLKSGWAFLASFLNKIDDGVFMLHLKILKRSQQILSNDFQATPLKN